MSEYELPPLRIRIEGDSSDFKKSLDEVLRAIKQVEKATGQKALNLQQRQAQAAKQAKADLKQELDAKEAAHKRWVQDQKIQATIAQVNAKNTMAWNNILQQQANQQAATRAQQLRNQTAQQAAAHQSRMQQLNQQFSLQQFARRQQNAHDRQVLARQDLQHSRYMQQLRQRASRQRFNFSQQMTQQRQLMAQQNLAHQQNVQQIRQQQQLQRLGINQQRLNQMQANLNNPIAQRRRRARVRGFDREGSALGARSDVYMHRGVLQSLASAASGLLAPGMALQQSEMQLSVYTKSLQKARDVTRQLQDLAILSPYSTNQLIEATATMTRYGMQVDKAVTVTKHLADIAGGSSEKMHLLSYAMAQVTSMGKLAGQELRQLQEAGFNPLVQISKASGKSMKELASMMRKGQISAEAVAAALQLATAKGGDFEGFAYKASLTVQGLSDQIKEIAQQFASDVYKMFEKDLEDGLKTLLGYVRAFQKWAKEHEQQIKLWTMFALKVFGAVVAFHALALVVAYTRWAFHSLRGLVLVLTGTFRTLGWVLAGVRWAFSSVGIAAISAWLSALGPIGLAIAAIGVLAAACAGILVWVLGVDKSFKYLKMTLGFFWNISHNVGVIFKYMGGVFDSVYTNIIRGLGKMGEVFHSTLSWLGKALYQFGQTVTWPIKFAFELIYEKLPQLMPDLKFDLPSMNLKDLLGMKLEPLPDAPTAEDPGKYNWDELLKGNGKDGQGKKDKPEDAVMAGGQEHAVRLWKAGMYMGSQNTGAVKDKEDKKIDYLRQIAKNTSKDPLGHLSFANLGGIQ